MSASKQTSRNGSITSFDEKDLEKGTSGRNSESDISTAPEHDANAASDNKGTTSQRQQQQPKPSDQTADLDWDGSDDGDNPLNWTKKRKIFYTAIPTGIATVCTIASSIYTPGRDGVIRDFGVSDEVSILPFSFYVVGLAFGPMLGKISVTETLGVSILIDLAAPTSENFGRRNVYLIGMPLFALFTLGAGFSNGIASLTICRFFAGLFGSPGLSIGSATLSDMWSPQERLIPFACYVTAPFLGPAIG